MIARIGQVWVESLSGNCIVLLELIGGPEAQWIGDYYAGPIGNLDTYNIEPRNFITRKIITQEELFTLWRQTPGPRT
jgi:hypothetical protein